MEIILNLNSQAILYRVSFYITTITILYNIIHPYDKIAILPTGKNFMKKLSLRPLLTGGLLSCLVSFPVIGHSENSTASFSPQQRQEIISIVKQALKDDPTLMETGIQALMKKKEQQRAALSSQTIKEKKNLLLRQLPTDGLMGNPDAAITITEFYDPNCGYCKKMLPILIDMVKKHKEVKVILKVIPILSENSKLQSQAIIAAARQNNYVAMMRSLMTSQEDINLNTIKSVAQKLKLNADQLATDMKADSITNALNNNLQLTHDLGVEGTPTLIINGEQIIQGAVSYETLENIIEKLKK